MDPKQIINTIFYHSNCQDGLASAWVAKKFADAHGLTYEYVGITNGSSVNEMTDAYILDKNVVFIDYAPSYEQLKVLEEKAKAYFILDHHVSNEKRLIGNPNVRFEMTKSGVGLAWEYFFGPDQPMPVYLQMIQDRDLWKWNVPQSKDFSEGFYTECLLQDTLADKFVLFDKMNDPQEFKQMILLGSALNRKKDHTLAYLAKTVSKKRYTYEGLTVCLVNCDHSMASDLGSTILNTNPDIDFVVCWRYAHDAEKYYCSLRSKATDVSKICEKYGGGGHKAAAGCETTIHPSILFTT